MKQAVDLVRNINRNLLGYAVQVCELGRTGMRLLRPVFGGFLLDPSQMRRVERKDGKGGTASVMTSLPTLGCVAFEWKSTLIQMEEVLHLHQGLSQTIKDLPDLSPTDIAEVQKTSPFI